MLKVEVRFTSVDKSERVLDEQGFSLLVTERDR